MVPGWRLVLPVAFFARRVRLSMLLSVFQYLSVPGRSDCAGGRPPALFLHSAGRLGETPRPSLVSLLAACVHRPGLFVTCSGRVWRGRRGWVQPWVRVLFFPGRPRRFGYPYFAPRGAYGRFSALPVVWARPGGRQGRQADAEGAWGCFPGGPLCRSGAALPVSPGMGLFCSQRRVGAFCRRPGGLGASGRLWGGQVCTEGSRGVRFPGALPCRWRLPGSFPGWACFAPRGACRRFAALPVFGASRRAAGPSGLHSGCRPGAPGAVFLSSLPPFFCAPI